MNRQETQQVAARNEKWVPFAERVKISSTNIRLETTMPQKEETFQVIIDIIKNSMCFKAFTISADVPENFMQQFWYSIKKVQDTDSYKFLLANKKCTINAEVFRKILNICPRVEGVDFIDVPDDDTILIFLIDLGYKGPLNWHTNMFVDHMHQPWRTLATIINKCLSRKTTSNDKLRKSRIDILWGMFNKENVDYPELIWEDFAYQINHRIENRSRRKNMPYPRFTKIIINHFLKQHKSLTNLNHKHYHTIKDDGIVSKLKFVRIGEDYQEYGLPIPDVMLTDVIKHLESNQMSVKYSTNQIPPKKSRAKKKTSNKRRVKKKVTLSADDNISFDDPDAALELAKSISQTEAKETEVTRKVHATHARIVIESIPESAKKKSSGRSANIMQVLKESKKTSKRQPCTGGSNEGTSSKPGVPDESIVVSATSSEGIGTKPGVPNEDKDITEEKVILEWGDEQDSEFSINDNDDVEKDDKDGDADDEGDDHVSDTQDFDNEDVKIESDEDEIYKYKIRVRKDEDVEMKDVEVKESNKGEEKVTDAAKEEAEKTSEANDDTKKFEFPPSSSSLSISSALCLDRHLSDHRPILLREVLFDFEGANGSLSAVLTHPFSLSCVYVGRSVCPPEVGVPKGVLKTMESIRSKFFNGVDSSDRKISWVAWDNVLASKLNGGLGVSSFFALNASSLLKWVWRFISGDGSLWCKVIQAIYGSKFDLHVTDQPSIWCSILREVKSLKDSGFDFSFTFSLCCSQKSWIREILVANKMELPFVSSPPPPRFFSPGLRDGAEPQRGMNLLLQIETRMLTVIRNFIDDLFLPSSDVATRWVKFIPIKVNVFSWRARRDRLPTRVNLSRRGVSVGFPICDLL
ncbi:hypothetical protein Tco_1199710 [Tanacetum coccineum]